jgi:hypothetical protein
VQRSRLARQPASPSSPAPERLVSGRETLAALAGFLLLSAAFQAPGLSRDWVLSDASGLRSVGLWAERPEMVEGILPPFDYVRYFAPQAAFIRRELRAGRLPLWNPEIATGLPVVESLQSALLHPFTVLLLALPLEPALSLLAIVRLAIAGAGAFTLARVLGCAVPSASAAGILFMFSPLHLLFRFSPLTTVSMMLPWLLLASELRLRGASARRVGAAWALLGTLTILGGHAETIVHVLGVAWLYHLARTASLATPGRLRRVGRELLFLAACSVLAALGAAAVIWGHTEVVLDSQVMRFRNIFAGYPHLPWAHLESFLVPAPEFANRTAAYLGTVTLALAVVGALEQGPFTPWPVTALGVAALLAAYAVRPVAPLLQALPLLNVADHTRLILVVHLALALLAARGLEALRRAPTRRALGWAAFTAAAVLAVRMPSPPRPTFQALYGGKLALGVAAALIACPRGIRRQPAWAWTVTGIVLFDLFAVYGPAPRRGLRGFPPAPAVLSDVAVSPGDGRVFIAESLLPINVNLVYGVSSISGYEMMPGRLVELLTRAGLQPSIAGVVAPPVVEPRQLRLLSLLNVRYLVVPRPLDTPAAGAGLAELRRAPVAVYRNLDALPRAFAVYGVRVATSPAEVLALLDDPTVDLRAVAIVESPVTAGASTPAASARPPPQTTVREYRPGRAEIAVDCAASCYLVFSETFSRGWRATVDGRPAPVVRADHALVGVPLPAGRHAVSLSYRPLALVLGGAVSAVTAALLLAAARRG